MSQIRNWKEKCKISSDKWKWKYNIWKSILCSKSISNRIVYGHMSTLKNKKDLNLTVHQIV